MAWQSNITVTVLITPPMSPKLNADYCCDNKPLCLSVCDLLPGLLPFAPKAPPCSSSPHFTLGEPPLILPPSTPQVTPAHDPNDFNTGKRHNLESINLFDDNGLINDKGGPFEGQPRFKVRYG